MIKKVLLPIILFLLIPFTAKAERVNSTDNPPPNYKVVSADNKYVFVMQSYLSNFKNYEKNGMYLNYGSTTPLWTVDWYANQVFIPNDGRYIVRKGDPASMEYGYYDEAISFFEDGKLIKTYYVSDLVDFPWALPRIPLEFTFGHYKWMKPIELNYEWGKTSTGVKKFVSKDEWYEGNQGVTFDEKSQTIKLETALGDEYIFNYTTGEMLSAKRPARFIALFTFILLFIPYVLYLIRGSSKQIQFKRLLKGFIFSSSLSLLLAILAFAIGFAWFFGLRTKIFFFIYQILTAPLFEFSWLFGWKWSFDSLIKLFGVTFTSWLVPISLLIILNYSLVWVLGKFKQKRFR